jgi:hypothetical protein
MEAQENSSENLCVNIMHSRWQRLFTSPAFGTAIYGCRSRLSQGSKCRIPGQSIYRVQVPHPGQSICWVQVPHPRPVYLSGLSAASLPSLSIGSKRRIPSQSEQPAGLGANPLHARRSTDAVCRTCGLNWLIWRSASGPMDASSFLGGRSSIAYAHSRFDTVCGFTCRHKGGRPAHGRTLGRSLGD